MNVVNGSRYPSKIGLFSSHSQISKLINALKPTSILDVGCGDGSLLERLIAEGPSVWGVEPDLNDSKIASKKGIKVIASNVEDAFQGLNLEFDVILYADVLEHLHNPELILKKTKAFMRSTSKIIISVPNIANISTRIGLLFGKFNYTERGILDKTHLRFFTQKSLLEMIDECDFSLIEKRITPIPIELFFPNWVPLAISRSSQQILFFLTKIFPKLLGYQFIVIISDGN